MELRLDASCWRMRGRLTTGQSFGIDAHSSAILVLGRLLGVACYDIGHGAMMS
jgi:hypothetical protein